VGGGEISLESQASKQIRYQDRKKKEEQPRKKTDGYGGVQRKLIRGEWLRCLKVS